MRTILAIILMVFALPAFASRQSPLITMTTAERATFTSAKAGQIIYNTDLTEFEIFNGTSWVSATASVNSSLNMNGSTILNVGTPVNSTDAANKAYVDSHSVNLNVTAPLQSTGGSNPVISITQAGSTQNGYLSSADWNTFNSKSPALSFTSPLGVAANTVSISQASGSQNGYLSSTDWNTFNSKQSALGYTAANVALSNLTTPTDLNQNLIFDSSLVTAQVTTGTTAVSSPSLSLSSGAPSGASANSGNVSLMTGAPTGLGSNSGTVLISTGNASNTTGNSGDITILTGSAATTRGSVSIDGLKVHLLQDKAIFDPTYQPDAVGPDAINLLLTTTPATSGLDFAHSASVQTPDVTGGADWSNSLNVLTGDQLALTGTGGTGSIFINSGSVVNAPTGASGQVSIGSGGTSSGNTGMVQLFSGNSTSTGTSGLVNIVSGAGASSGVIQLITGNAGTGSSGNLILQTGTAATTRGHIQINGSYVLVGNPSVPATIGSNAVILGTPNPSSAVGQNATIEGGSFHTNTASGQDAHVEGSGNVASGRASHAEGGGNGSTTTASGEAAHTEGSGTTASAAYAHAEGQSNTASGIGSHAEGENTSALGRNDHVEGFGNTANANNETAPAHVEGGSNSATGAASHAGGQSTVASGNYSFTSGLGTTSNGDGQMAVGEYNIVVGTPGAPASTDELFTVGNGVSLTHATAFSVRRDGLVDAHGNTVKVGDLTYVGSTSGTLDLKAAAATTTYSLVWPSAQGGASTLLSNDGAGNLSWVAAPLTGANTSLSNLTATAINQSLVPNGNRTLNLGSGTDLWNNVYAGQLQIAVAADGLFSAGLIRGANGNGAGLFSTGLALPDLTTAQFVISDSNANGSEPVALMTYTGAATAPLALETGNATAGASGDIILRTGTATTTRGKIQFQDGTQGTAGQIWTSTDTVGSGSWQPAPASGANTTLSNLTSPVAVNQNLLPGTNGTLNIGQFSGNKWANIYLTTELASVNIGAQDFSLYDTTSTARDFLMATNFTTPFALPAGDTVNAYIGARDFVAGDTYSLGVFTESDSQVSAVATGNISVETGNKTAGTGNSGAITLQTGTSSGGTRGDVVLNGRRTSVLTVLSIGNGNSPSGLNSMAQGNSCTASNDYSSCFGTSTVASGLYSHAEGNTTSATANSAHSEGFNTAATGTQSHSEGNGSSAGGSHSHAEGAATSAAGGNTHSQNDATVANGSDSSAAGTDTTANADNSFVVGIWNNPSGTAGTPVSTDEIFQVGNGTSSLAKATAFSVRRDGMVDTHGNAIHVGSAVFVGTTSGTVTITQPATITSYSVTLPAAQGASQSTLLNDGAGNLSWFSSWTKYTKTFTDFSSLGASTNSIALFTLPAKVTLDRVVIKHSVAFSGGTLTGYTVSVGVSGNPTKYASAFNVFQAVASNIFQNSVDDVLEDFTSGTSVTATATATGDTLDHATAGSVDIWIKTEPALP